MTQVQELQQYLAWWSMMLYDTFMLTNEYNNYYEFYQSARYASGSYEYSSTLCDPGSTSDAPTFCVVQNNILSAYPGDLYSDEIGVPLSGLGITVFPGARMLPSPVSTDPWPVLDTKYMVQNFGLRNKTAWVLASVYDDIATAWEESMPENPYAVNSTMETYWSPLVRHYSATQDQVAILAQPSPPPPPVLGRLVLNLRLQNSFITMLINIQKAHGKAWKQNISRFTPVKINPRCSSMG